MHYAVGFLFFFLRPFKHFTMHKDPKTNVFIDFINQETTKNALKKNTQELIDRGGFGSPTYFFEGSMFFGNDRIPLLEEQLKVN